MRACVCAQSRPTLCDPMDYSPPGSFVHGILQARTGVGSHFLLQGIFLTQGSNPHLLHLLHWQADSLLSESPGKPTHFPVQLNIQRRELKMAPSSSRCDFVLGLPIVMGFLGGAPVENLPANVGDAGDSGSIPGSERSPGVGNGNPLQYSCLGNLKEGGAWWAIVHRVAKSRSRLSD